MLKLQSQGVHHITIVGADRQTSIDFWEGLLGMPFVFEQPNLEPPFGVTHADVLLQAHKLRVERGDHHIAEVRVADAIEALVLRNRTSLSDDRSPRNPY